MTAGPRLTRKALKPGDRYGRLTAIAVHSVNSGGLKRWRFRCDCGEEVVAIGSKVRTGNTSSCGCLRAETSGARTLARQLTHGMSRTSEYRIWIGMLRRCEQPHRPEYKRYGARGITVCERWHDFKAFFANMGRRPSPLHSIDRIDVNGNYEPGNCRWVLPVQQGRNRRNARIVEYGGRLMSLSEAAEIAGINYATVHSRIEKQGWSISRALSTST